MSNHCFDVAVIGAGLIGASTACHISQHRNVVLVEQEPQAGYHSSGRSAAVLIAPYGGPIARALTAVSTGFLLSPPGGFASFPLTSERGALILAGRDQLPLLDHWQVNGDSAFAGVRRLSGAEAAKRVPILKGDLIAAAVVLPEVRDIDAAALLQGYLKKLRAHGGTLRTNSAVVAIKYAEGMWILETTAGALRAKVLVNAAGAWADQIASLAGVAGRGLVPTRRTMIVVDPPAGVDVRQWPLVADAAETLYFKPDGGRLAVSPADRSPVIAQDVQPEEWDVAVAVERIESATSLRVRCIEHQWAGLRTIAPDEEPVIGFDPEAPDFIWAAGFAGFGVQAAPAAGRCCSELLLHGRLQAELSELGVDAEQLSPRRLPAIAVDRAM